MLYEGTHDHVNGDDELKALSRSDRLTLSQDVNESTILAVSKVDVAEAYSPVRLTDPALCQPRGLRPGAALDLRTGWNFNLRRDRDEALRLLAEQNPELLVVSPECKAFSAMQRIN